LTSAEEQLIFIFSRRTVCPNWAGVTCAELNQTLKYTLSTTKTLLQWCPASRSRSTGRPRTSPKSTAILLEIF